MIKLEFPDQHNPRAICAKEPVNTCTLAVQQAELIGCAIGIAYNTVYVHLYYREVRV